MFSVHAQLIPQWEWYDSFFSSCVWISQVAFQRAYVCIKYILHGYNLTILILLISNIFTQCSISCCEQEAGQEAISYKSNFKPYVNTVAQIEEVRLEPKQR